MLSTTTVFGFAAATALIRFVLAVDSWVGADIVVPGSAGLGVLDVAPTPSLTNTRASFLPTAAAAASVMSPFALEYAKRKLADVHGAGTAATAGFVPAAAAGGVETQFAALSTVSLIEWKPGVRRGLRRGASSVVPGSSAAVPVAHVRLISPWSTEPAVVGLLGTEAPLPPG